jgi:hypothetical protein
VPTPTCARTRTRGGSRWPAALWRKTLPITTRRRRTSPLVGSQRSRLPRTAFDGSPGLIERLGHFRLDDHQPRAVDGETCAWQRHLPQDKHRSVLISVLAGDPVLLEHRLTFSKQEAPPHFLQLCREHDVQQFRQSWAKNTKPLKHVALTLQSAALVIWIHTARSAASRSNGKMWTSRSRTRHVSGLSTCAVHNRPGRGSSSMSALRKDWSTRRYSFSIPAARLCRTRSLFDERVGAKDRGIRSSEVTLSNCLTK